MDCVIAKYNSSGTLQWDKLFAEGENTYIDELYGVDVNGSYMYVIGRTTSTDDDGDAFVVKVNTSTPSITWKKYLGSSAGAEDGWDIDVDGSGNVYVTGDYSGGPGSLTYKLNSSGAYQWHQIVGEAVGKGVETDGTNVFVAGIRKPLGQIGPAPDQDVMFLKYACGDGTLAWSLEWSDDDEGDEDYYAQAGYDIALDDSDYAYLVGYAPYVVGDWTEFSPTGALSKSDGDVPNWTLSDAGGSGGWYLPEFSDIEGGTENRRPNDGAGGNDVLTLKYDLT